MENEIWKPIKGFEGFYEVSNLGRVKSFKRSAGKIIKFQVNCKGYRIIRLNKNSVTYTKKISQLVAIAFLNHTPCGYKIIVDHINEIKTDDRPENLQLISNRLNRSRSIDKSKTSSKYIGVCFNRNKWKARIRVGQDNINLGVFANEDEAGEMYQRALNNISLYNGNTSDFIASIKYSNF